MALHIVDRDADAAARKLAAMRKLSISDAVKMACLEAIAADMHKQPLAERLAGIHKLVRSKPATGRTPDKAFYDREWGE